MWTTTKGLPLKAKIAFILATIYLLGALIVLLGNGEIRAGYLQDQGQSAYALAFIAIQLGVLTAATAISIEHAHPYARRWRRVVRRLTPTLEEREAKIEKLTGLVGSHNGLVDQRDAVLAMAGKQVEISRNDVPRQMALARHWEMLASSEAVEEKMFAKAIAATSGMTQAQRRAFLIGDAELPTFQRKTTLAVNTRREALRGEMNKLREERRAINRPQRLVPAASTAGPAATPAATTLTIDGKRVPVSEPPKAAVAGNGGGH
jgi:hypothetical protein